MDDVEARKLAITRLKEQRDVRVTLGVYIPVNVFLWLLWAFTDDTKSGIPWPIWPTAGWGIVIALSAWKAYGVRPITEDDVRREMERTAGAVDIDRDGRADPH